MNCFAFRYSKAGNRFRGEYRLAHWAGFKAVLDAAGRPILFSFPLDASLAAANELVKSLNGNSEFWHGPNSNAAREAAERLFARNDDGGH